MNKFVKKIIDFIFPATDFMYSDIFGRMTFIEVRRRRNYHWECLSSHPVSSNPIEFFIDVEKEEMPSQDQEEFLKKILQDITPLTVAASKFIFSKKGGLLIGSKFSGEESYSFYIVCISIPVEHELPLWKASLVSTKTNVANFLFEVTFEGHEPKMVSYDS